MKTWILILFIIFNFSFLYSKNITKVKYYKNNVLGEYTPYSIKDQHLPILPNHIKPIYYIHIGRHGSRYADTPGIYSTMEEIFEKANQKNLLTAKGKRFYFWYRDFVEEVRNHEGELSPLGKQQIRDIAKSITEWIPGIIKGEKQIKVFTSPSKRVIESQEIFTDYFKSNNSNIYYSIDTLESYRALAYWNTLKPYNNLYLEKRENIMNTEKTIHKYIKDIDILKEYNITSYMFVYYLRNIVASVPNIGGYESTRYTRYFSKKDFKKLLETLDLSSYMALGRCKETNAVGINTYQNIWKNIIDNAIIDIKEGKVQANLNFSHDIVIGNILAQLNASPFNKECKNLLNIGQTWNCSYIPMGAIIQFLVCYSEIENTLKIYALFNGNSITLPLKKDKDGAYLWEDFIKLSKVDN